MMRDILFRAKAKHNPTLWVYGDYLSTTTRNGEKKHYIKRAEDGILTPVEIIPETLGETTGLLDCIKQIIFENDVVDYKDEYGVIEFDKEQAAFIVHFDGWTTDFDHIYPYELEVIGNTTDSPELLGGAE